MKTDVLVIGSGIAGLTFAIKVASARPDLSIFVINKNSNDVCNTAQAQGGIAVVLDKLKDSFEQHIEDTFKAGQRLNDRAVVEMVVSQAPQRLQELINWGASFDTDEMGALDLALEGGHSQKRIVHHRDLTGKEMVNTLSRKAATLSNIIFHDHFFVKDLVMDKPNNKCLGIKVLDKKTGEDKIINSRITFLATGGSGRIFQNTTNPSVATGDGIAMAHRAGAEITNMNFIQFHPTALYQKDMHALFLISEAVRGFGAQVVNSKGERFLFQYDERGELATRDIVSEAIVKELKISGEECVFMDCRHLDPKAFTSHFTTIKARCASLEIDIRKHVIPIVPAAHYQTGGICVNEYAETTIQNLYASGECAHTGLHGANRLASNSLLEALVFSHGAAGKVLEVIHKIQPKDFQVQKTKSSGAYGADPLILERMGRELNQIMSFDLLYASNNNEKEKALDHIRALQAKLKMYPNAGNQDHLELDNMIQTAGIILEHTIKYTIDRKNGYLQNKAFRRKRNLELA